MVAILTVAGGALLLIAGIFGQLRPISTIRIPGRMVSVALVLVGLTLLVAGTAGRVWQDAYRVRGIMTDPQVGPAMAAMVRDDLGRNI